MFSLFAIPWRWRTRPTSERVLVFVSRFDAPRGRGSGRWRQTIVLMRGGLKIRRHALKSPGNIGVSLYGSPLRAKFYTMSAWQDEASLMGFAHSPAHMDGIRALYANGRVDGVLISWWDDADGWRPGWRDAIRRADSATPGPYAGPADASETVAA
jgi:heme-degrading monooxygenase HmoA